METNIKKMLTKHHNNYRSLIADQGGDHLLGKQFIAKTAQNSYMHVYNEHTDIVVLPVSDVIRSDVLKQALQSMVVYTVALMQRESGYIKQLVAANLCDNINNIYASII